MSGVGRAVVGRRVLRLAPALASLLAISTALGQGLDREAAFLTIPTGARVVGIGRAGASLEGEPQSLSWNPASLAAVRAVTPLLSYYEGPLDFTVTQLAVALPLGELGTLGLAVNVQDFGDIPLFDASSPDVAVGSVSPNNLILGLTLGRLLPGRLAAGVTVKWVRSDLVEARSASTFAIDAGLLWAPHERVPAKLGLSAINLGPGLGAEGAGVSSPLPGRLRLGISYDVLAHLRPKGDMGLLLVTDLEHVVRHLSTGSRYFGAELRYRDALFLRAGHVSEKLIETNHGPALGIGLGLGSIRIDLAREFVNRLGDETHLSASVRL